MKSAKSVKTTTSSTLAEFLEEVAAGVREAGDDAPNGVIPSAAKRVIRKLYHLILLLYHGLLLKKLSLFEWRMLPEIAADGLGDAVEDEARGVDQLEGLYGGDVLRNNVAGRCSCV